MFAKLGHIVMLLFVLLTSCSNKVEESEIYVLYAGTHVEQNVSLQLFEDGYYDLVIDEEVKFVGRWEIDTGTSICTDSNDGVSVTLYDYRRNVYSDNNRQAVIDDIGAKKSYSLSGICVRKGFWGKLYILWDASEYSYLR